ncbi:hypothetical protein LIER_08997 [Lithospermum erythrorhizon]|uniref:Uncharacterized protein n=1 Tax=Lithospermum erythrorhizon TaxID=34254 RepID=A0AAV3PE94_LITER
MGQQNIEKVWNGQTSAFDKKLILKDWELDREKVVHHYTYLVEGGGRGVRSGQSDGGIGGGDNLENEVEKKKKRS